MRDNNPIADRPSPDGEKAVFSARLRPHRSLPKTGFWTIMILVLALAGSSSVMFMAMGAWPVMAFIVVDVVIIYGAFHVSYLTGRAYEDVVMTENSLVVKRVSPLGRVKEERLHPFWTRLKTAYDAEDDVVLAVKLESKGKQIAVGAFMNPKDKESFANALGEALASVKRGAPAAPA